jgi:hypothetical protein
LAGGGDLYRIVTLLLTVTGAPENGGTEADRILAAMHPPARVPEKSAPITTALVTLPDGAKVTITRAVPAGSPSWRHPEAEAAAALSADLAAALLNDDPPVSLAAGFASVVAFLVTVVLDAFEVPRVEVRAALAGLAAVDAPVDERAVPGLGALATAGAGLVGASERASGAATSSASASESFEPAASGSCAASFS